MIHETARKPINKPEEVLREAFGDLIEGSNEGQGSNGAIDAMFISADQSRALGVSGLPYYAPVAGEIANIPEFRKLMNETSGSILVAAGISEAVDEASDMNDEDAPENSTHKIQSIRVFDSCPARRNGNSADTEGSPEPEVIDSLGEIDIDDDLKGSIIAAIDRVLSGPGRLNDRGELVLDLKAKGVGPHYPVNLLLGERSRYPYPLVTTPKSAVDALGRGSFRASGGDQVLATRYVLHPEENGEPANRQFYLTENGMQIFYSADINSNVREARCLHSQNSTTITYETEDDLRIARTIFLLSQEDGMPNATEVQRVTVENVSDRPRDLRIVMTGVFGINGPDTIAQDVVYANLVTESELLRDDNGVPIALTMHAKPPADELKKRFFMLIGPEAAASGADVAGSSETASAAEITMDEYCTSVTDFIGSGDLAHPEYIASLPNTLNRKMASFFAAAKSFTADAGGKVIIDTFTGMCDREHDLTPDPYAAISCLFNKYKDQSEFTRVLEARQEEWDRYTDYFIPESGDTYWDAYVRYNLPFQVLYQTYVSRAFAWTQKSYRETGFREIQDIYASMYYLSASGQNDLVRTLIGSWVENVFEMGYANHNFTFAGKEPGACSDDQLWLVQAVYRYIHLTGDTDFLLQEFPVAKYVPSDVRQEDKGFITDDGSDREDAPKRTLWETICAILIYSGRISVGIHGLPLLDKADWNDTLRLDKDIYDGPEKEELYRKQLDESGRPYGTPLENTLCESIMNACLLKIAADQTAELARMIGDDEMAWFAGSIAKATSERAQEFAWKDDYFARCLINDGREYTYIGAGGDGLSADPDVDGSYFLNSYSWAILADIATEEQIRIMLGTVNRYLRTEAGLKLCTLIDYNKLGVNTGTSLYFPGDRENSGVFKHAAMMAAVASLQAARKVCDEKLADDLRELAFFMIDRTLPYKTLEDPYILKGNPRFCTQYNNSETCENIGPMLSGTASWLTLAIYEIYGFDVTEGSIRFDPILREGQESLRYTINPGSATIHVEVTSLAGRFRTGSETKYTCNGKPFNGILPRPQEGEYEIRIKL